MTRTVHPTAREILLRAPLDFSRRASYGYEERTESVVVHWTGGRRVPLQPARDERVSFALRDRFEAGAPTCREQLDRLAKRHGAPDLVTVSWRYEANWEGAAPRDESGQERLSWAALAEILNSL